MTNPLSQLGSSTKTIDNSNLAEAAYRAATNASSDASGKFLSLTKVMGGQPGSLRRSNSGNFILDTGNFSFPKQKIDSSRISAELSTKLT